MIKKTLYIGNPAYLSLRNDQMVIKMLTHTPLEAEITPEAIFPGMTRTIPIEDIGIVLLDHRQITITHPLIEKLLETNVALITCDYHGLPVGLMLPLFGNTTQCEAFHQQLSSSQPLQKQLWQQTIKAKILNQAKTLVQVSPTTEVGNLLAWADQVRSGDPDNLEGRAAAYYWKNIFTPFPDYSPFTRYREGPPPNHLLNFGYAILRGVVARSLVCSGLLPTLGIHHHNRYNAYCLADDIMEPYRPYVDDLVIEILRSDHPIAFLNRDLKAKLLTLPIV